MKDIDFLSGLYCRIFKKKLEKLGLEGKKNPCGTINILSYFPDEKGNMP